MICEININLRYKMEIIFELLFYPILFLTGYILGILKNRSIHWGYRIIFSFFAAIVYTAVLWYSYKIILFFYND